MIIAGVIMGGFGLFGILSVYNYRSEYSHIAEPSGFGISQMIQSSEPTYTTSVVLLIAGLALSYFGTRMLKQIRSLV
jgi:hypothetical protein